MASQDWNFGCKTPPSRLIFNDFTFWGCTRARSCPTTLRICVLFQFHKGPQTRLVCFLDSNTLVKQLDREYANSHFGWTHPRTSFALPEVSMCSWAEQMIDGRDIRPSGWSKWLKTTSIHNFTALTPPKAIPPPTCLGHNPLTKAITPYTQVITAQSPNSTTWAFPPPQAIPSGHSPQTKIHHPHPPLGPWQQGRQDESRPLGTQKWLFPELLLKTKGSIGWTLVCLPVLLCVQICASSLLGPSAEARRRCVTLHWETPNHLTPRLSFQMLARPQSQTRASTTAQMCICPRAEKRVSSQTAWIASDAFRGQISKAGVLGEKNFGVSHHNRELQVQRSSTNRNRIVQFKLYEHPMRRHSHGSLFTLFNGFLLFLLVKIAFSFMFLPS